MAPARRSTIVLLALTFSFAWSFRYATRADDAAGTDKASGEMVQAAKAFLDSLSDEQRKKATYEFKDDERLNWHFIPKARNGLPLAEMKDAQRELAKKLLASGMSPKGNVKASTIINLEPILKEIEKGSGPKRDSGLYYFTVFGRPDPAQTWAWRVEGHHLALNFTVMGDRAIASAPAFMGSNPADVRDGPSKGLRALGEEEDLGRAFVKSLAPEQQKTAIIAAKAYNDIVTGNQREAKLKQFEGLAASEMSAEQKAALMDLVGLYANRHRRELADQDLKRIASAGVDKVYFAWAGSLEKGQGHYYRIHGPTFLIEYDNTQNNANHIHSVWRDLQNDFGGDLLKKHYQETPHP
jgi:hypothetical protein